VHRSARFGVCRYYGGAVVLLVFCAASFLGFLESIMPSGMNVPAVGVSIKTLLYPELAIFFLVAPLMAPRCLWLAPEAVVSFFGCLGGRNKV
jgi:hypothetical protein